MRGSERFAGRRQLLKAFAGVGGAIAVGPVLASAASSIGPTCAALAPQGEGREILGGMFGLDDLGSVSLSTAPFLRGNDLFLVNGRSAIRLLVEMLQPSRVWMPSYLCEVMVLAVEKTPATVHYFPVDYSLNVPSLDWLDDVRPGDLVVLIDYLGFVGNEHVAVAARERGATVLEDAAGALLSPAVGSLGDFVLYSPRKFIGVADGGILSATNGTRLNATRLDALPAEWWLPAFMKLVQRREFERHGGDAPWFELCPFAENDAPGPIEAYPMSELSRLLMLNAFDFAAIARCRTGHYDHLAAELVHFALFPALDPGVVPLGFPIRVRNREALRHRFLENGICPAVHWPLEGFVPTSFVESHRLAADILTLPCDQRYGMDDMARIVALVRRYGLA